MRVNRTVAAVVGVYAGLSVLDLGAEEIHAVLKFIPVPYALYFAAPAALAAIMWLISFISAKKAGLIFIKYPIIDFWTVIFAVCCVICVLLLLSAHNRGRADFFALCAFVFPILAARRGFFITESGLIIFGGFRIYTLTAERIMDDDFYIILYAEMSSERKIELRFLATTENKERFSRFAEPK